MSAHSVVCPMRFTERLDQMRGFLETLGLQARVESERGGWLDMVAGAGMVALDRLTVAGHRDAVIGSEVFGQRLDVTDPDGQPVLVWPAPPPDSP
jgi:hypothetical protein